MLAKRRASYWIQHVSENVPSDQLIWRWNCKVRQTRAVHLYLTYGSGLGSIAGLRKRQIGALTEDDKGRSYQCSKRELSPSYDVLPSASRGPALIRSNVKGRQYQRVVEQVLSAQCQPANAYACGDRRALGRTSGTEGRVKQI